MCGRENNITNFINKNDYFVVIQQILNIFQTLACF